MELWTESRIVSRRTLVACALGAVLAAISGVAIYRRQWFTSPRLAEFRFSGPFVYGKPIEVRSPPKLVALQRLHLNRFGPYAKIAVVYLFDGVPGTTSPINVTVRGVDTTGDTVFEVNEVCHDARPTIAEIRSHAAEYENRFLWNQPEFYLSPDDFLNVAELTVTFTR